MASFRTHISFGIAAGILGIVGLVTLAIANVPALMVAVFLAVALGSILPDMDSDSGVPFHIAFGSLTIVATALSFIALRHDHPSSWQIVIAATIGVAVFVWGIVGHIFKRFTRHRGMAHSIPAAVLAGLITFSLASRLYYSDSDSFILGIAIVVGCLIHLILDEVWAAVNFHGTLFIPNKAFGSALKLWSDSSTVNLLVFGAIVFFLLGNVERLWNLAVVFWKSVL